MSDLEIYIRVADFQLVIDWLGRRLGSLRPISAENDVLVFRGSLDDLRVTLTPSVENSVFTSVFISGQCGDWEDDRSFAHEAFAALGVEIRFDAGPKYASTQFVAITEDGENIVTWDLH